MCWIQKWKKVICTRVQAICSKPLKAKIGKLMKGIKRLKETEHRMAYSIVRCSCWRFRLITQRQIPWSQGNLGASFSFGMLTDVSNPVHDPHCRGEMFDLCVCSVEVFMLLVLGKGRAVFRVRQTIVSCVGVHQPDSHNWVAQFDTCFWSLW